LRRAKKIADDANASKSTFMALAGHDILQPLNAANLYASSILDSDNYNPLVMQQLKHAIQNTESIISSLLEISRLDMGGMVPKRDVFSLHDLLQGLVNDAVLLQSESDLTLRYRPTSVVVFSDKHYLRRILQNFITNAIKYTRSGKVLVGCRRHYRHEKPYVTICVIDNGPGISDHECEIIFNDFYRCDRQDQHGIPGVGLGLSVVKRFGELLHHPVRCRSIVASGSCFSVDVPMADADTIKQLSHADTLAFDHLHNLRIAYVDDDMHNLLATSALLSHWQCQVVLLENVQAARDYARAIKNKSDLPDVLLMDYQLGDTQVDGLLLAEELVGSWQQRFIASMPVPVCIVSAATGDELPQKVEHLGFNFLSKPVKPARLRALLTQIAQHK
jgi:CheY-like chemotaxis protein/two-component sensor histidine kinase